MKNFNSAEIIGVGTELLMGQIVNTNAAYIARELSFAGIPAYRQSVVGDNAKRLKETLLYAIKQNDLVITTGGLGPTEDDITIETIANALGRKLVLDETVKERISQYFHAYEKKIPLSINKQAMVPEGSIILNNPVGTAPGIIIEHDLFSGGAIIMLPGPPNEMKGIFNESVFKYLVGHAPIKIHSKYVRLIRIGESAAEEKIKDIIDESSNPTIAPYCSDGECMFRVSYTETDNKDISQLQSVIDQIKDRLGEYIYEIGPRSLEQVVFDGLNKLSTSVSFAESCTAGLLGAALTNFSGSSRVFKGGVIAYSNEAKINLLGVNPKTIEKFKAVSKETANEMAIGCRNAFQTDYAVSVTGVAGPEPSDDKPVGLVYIALSTKEGTRVEELNFRGGRARIRRTAVLYALDMLRREIAD